ncbi:MAG: HD domain-containing protein [Thermodesulfovibrionales bacterium]
MIIKTKIITAIALTIVLIIGITTAILLRVQHEKLISAKFEDTVFLGDILEKTVENAMQRGDKQEVQQIIENIGKNKEIDVLRILSPEGVIVRSTRPQEIGSKSHDLLKTSFEKAPQAPTLVSDTRINYFRNIENRKPCYRCHDSREPVIGVIQVHLDITRSLTTIQAMKRLLLLTNVVVVLAVSFILSMLFSRLVMNPLQQLLSSIREVEKGNWNAAVTAAGDDELGIISRSFNSMVTEINNLYGKNLQRERELSKMKTDLEHRNTLEELNEKLEFKIKELETANRAITTLSKEVRAKNSALEGALERLKKVNEIGRVLTTIIEPDELVKIITRTTADLVNTERAVLYLKHDAKRHSVIHYQRGVGVKHSPHLAERIESACLDLLLNGRSIFVPHQLRASILDPGEPVSQIGVPLKMKGKIIGAMVLENKNNSQYFTEDDLELLTTLANQAVVAVENAVLYDNVKNNYFATIQSLINALEASDRFTKGHSERVRLISGELARHIGLDYREIEVLEHASILHDIGKIGIDSFILQKQGKLTPKEYGMIKMHPLIGDAILAPIDTLEHVRQTIIQHHERYDGKGYPYGLQGEELSLKSRILSVVDTFDAMMSERPYRKSLSVYKIKEELRMHAGSQFDPYVVESFIELLDRRGEELMTLAGYNTLQGIA